MNTKINIYHGAFEEDDLNKRVFSYTTADDPADCGPILKRAFEIFNAPIEYLGKDDSYIARRYRFQRLRSLSVGDVVEVEGVRHQCLSSGWSVGRTVDYGEAEASRQKW
jgi:hypothetical protein